MYININLFYYKVVTCRKTYKSLFAISFMVESNFRIEDAGPASFAGRMNFPDSRNPSRIYIMESCFPHFHNNTKNVAKNLDWMLKHTVFKQSDFNLGFLWYSDSRNEFMCDFNGYEYVAKDGSGWKENPTHYSWVMKGDVVRDNGEGLRIETGCGTAKRAVGMEETYRLITRTLNEYAVFPPFHSDLLSLGFDLCPKDF